MELSRFRKITKNGRSEISAVPAENPYLLSALLKKAAADAGRTLNITELRTVAAAFFASRLTDRKTHAGYCRRATMSRRTRDSRAQEKSDFHWKPARPRR